jgi:hypothetical protein
LEWAIIASTAREWEDFFLQNISRTEWSESDIDRYRFDIRWHQPATSPAKAGRVAIRDGTAKAVPFHKGLPIPGAVPFPKAVPFKNSRRGVCLGDFGQNFDSI